LKSEAEAIRRQAEEADERRETERTTAQQQQFVSPVEGWRSDVSRNREAIERLSAEAADLERQMQESSSILEQAMVRGNLVDKRRKLAELERVNRDLEQRIEQTESSPLIPSA
jgi:plectin